MNLRQGRIGKQESAALGMMASVIGGIFLMNTASFYGRGNSSYLSSVLSAGLALLAFYLVAESMRRTGCEHLAMLYQKAFGRILCLPMGLLTACTVAVSAVVPLTRLMYIMGWYVFMESSAAEVALYFLPPILFLAWRGLETIGRTAKLYLPSVVLSVVVALIVASPAYEAFRLYPLLGNGLRHTLELAVIGVSRFFPALLALLICGKGMQGLDNVAVSANVATIGGAVLTGGSQLFLGMTYSYQALSKMHSPMYQLTMSVRTGSAYLRTDKVLLFMWTIGGLIAGGFFAYAAALMYASACKMRDIRPAAAMFAILIGSLTVMGHLELPAFERLMELW